MERPLILTLSGGRRTHSASRAESGRRQLRRSGGCGMEWFWYFLFYSFLGFLLEVGYAWWTGGSLDRKCLLLLPLCPVYGLGACAVLLLPGAVLPRPPGGCGWAHRHSGGVRRLRLLSKGLLRLLLGLSRSDRQPQRAGLPPLHPGLGASPAPHGLLGPPGGRAAVRRDPAPGVLGSPDRVYRRYDRILGHPAPHRGPDPAAVAPGRETAPIAPAVKKCIVPGKNVW